VPDRIDRLERRGFAVAPLRDLWRRAVAAPASTSSVWLHGDLHPRNLLGRGGRLVAVIDWGDLTAGDPATDLAAAWLLWDTGVHDRFRVAYGQVDDAALWDRAVGWATVFALILLEVGLEDDPAFAAVGARAVERLGRSAAPEVC
jgi:aminoglycoside phosphotransferase (APT) family kinase protein